MGRNAHPKLDEWRDGELYEFSANAAGDTTPPRPDDGRQIVYRVTNVVRGIPVERTLACCYADGFQSVMASMYADGFAQGKREGMLEAQRQMRRALGLDE